LRDSLTTWCVFILIPSVYRIENLGDHLQQGGPSMIAVLGPGQPSMAAKIVVDGPGRPTVV